MRARAGDPPRTMTQKILAGRADDSQLSVDLPRVKVDQVILARDPDRVMAEVALLGGKKCVPEVGIAYDSRCVTQVTDPRPGIGARAYRDALALGMLVARPGIGFPAQVHLERFGSPARLALTDEPRLAALGGAGMLTLVAAPAQLAEALVTGAALLRSPRSVQVLLSGRVRPFVCVRDVGLELIRRGLGEAIRRIDLEHGAPVVIEFAGPSARLLSVSERAILAALAPQLGAAASVFVSDEKTEVYLRDQRRSKAHRSLQPDPGAPCDDVITVDLTGGPLHDKPKGMSKRDAELAVQQVVYSVQGAAGERAGVQLLLDGERTDQVLGQPASEPLTNADPTTTLSMMNVTLPEEGMVVSGDTLGAEGVASAFEATFQWEIRLGDQVVAKDFAMTQECCKLSPWTVSVDVSGLAPGTYTFVATNDDPSGGEGFAPDSDSKTFVIE